MNGVHILSFLSSKQANMTFSYKGDNNIFHWEETMLKGRVGRKSIQLYSQFRPLVSQNIKPSFTTHQVLGLILRRYQQFFVSCHKRQNHWTTQLSQLILAFDNFTWLIIVSFYVLLAYSFKFTSESFENRSNSFLFVLVTHFFAAIDQSCK